MMSCNLAPPLLIFLLLIPGAHGNKWSVTYNQQKICSLKGSTVFINGTYTIPDDHTKQETFWTTDPVEKTNLLSVPGYPDRVQYFDNQGKMSLSLSNVMKTDEHQYCFRIISDKDKWVGKPGVTLEVTDLQVGAPPELPVGEEVILTCKTTCSLTGITFIWYKNGYELKTKMSKNHELHLHPVSSEDGGSYSCSVKGYEHLPSAARSLGVTYPPTNVSVSISPAGEIVEGISVTLTCVHNANPLLMNYIWFKREISVGTAKTYNISKITSEDSGEYKCMCSNERGVRNSTAVMLNVLYPPTNVSVSISPAGEIVEGISVTLTCVHNANPLLMNYIWFKREISVGTSKTYNISKITSEDSGEYKCMCSNEHGKRNSTAVMLNVLYQPKYVSLCVTSSGETVKGSPLTLTCSSDSNPEQSYLWFKDGEIVGSGQSYEAPQNDFYSCEARNKLGSQRSAPVSLTVTGHSLIMYVVVGVMLFGYVVLLAVIFWLRGTNKKKRGTNEERSLEDIYQNVGVNAEANDEKNRP